ncbi:MAG: type II toxin-antitoxin system Phd/YefM family antitoxin [Spirochaetaceae bacterium]|nr:type II toxin-antitoxin system Phd/YefM family antitoxin [Spirochaetaceae bacterium]
MAVQPNTWKLFNAKNQLSELVEKATATPQIITVRGKAAVIVISIDEYRKITEPKRKLSEVVFDPALADIQLDLERDRTSRERETPFEFFD